ncbi:transposase [Ruminococcus sp.]
MRFPQGFVCPECGYTKYYHIKKRHTYQCKCCRHQTSVTSRTVMDKTHLKLTYWPWHTLTVLSVDMRIAEIR